MDNLEGKSTDCIVTAYTYVYVINTKEVIKLLLYV